MFTAQITSENNGLIQKVDLYDNAALLTYSQVLRLWRTDESFRTLFISVLADAPYTAFRLETPSVTISTLSRPFQFVILDSPYLNPVADATMFSLFLSKAPTEDVTAFANLGKDAILVVPTQKAAKDCYAHLAAFTRLAGATQNHALWQKVGELIEQTVSEKPIWLNTAGAGVPWLHIRLDSTPKYYGYGAYIGKRHNTP